MQQKSTPPAQSIIMAPGEPVDTFFFFSFFKLFIYLFIAERQIGKQYLQFQSLMHDPAGVPTRDLKCEGQELLNRIS